MLVLCVPDNQNACWVCKCVCLVVIAGDTWKIRKIRGEAGIWRSELYTGKTQKRKSCGMHMICERTYVFAG